MIDNISTDIITASTERLVTCSSPLSWAVSRSAQLTLVQVVRPSKRRRSFSLRLSFWHKRHLSFMVWYSGFKHFHFYMPQACLLLMVYSPPSLGHTADCSVLIDVKRVSSVSLAYERKQARHHWQTLSQTHTHLAVCLLRPDLQPGHFKAGSWL